MEKIVKCFAKVVIHLLFLNSCSNELIRLYKTNERVSGVFQTHHHFTSVKCSVLYESTPQALSFNYKAIDHTCELSTNYPESSTIETGWKVYARIVDGAWGNWMNWDSCSEECGDGTRSRSRVCNNPSPSNGGESCHGSNVISEHCNIKDCNGFVGGYFLSTDTMSWGSAKSACEALSSRLVIFDSQEEINSIMTTSNIQRFDHWIGMTCDRGRDCVWLDGRLATSGFQAWGVNEPNGADCVWIGVHAILWDDAPCDGNRYYICEEV